MKVLIADAISEEGIDYLRQAGFEVIYETDLTPAQLRARIGDASAIIVRSKTQITQELIEVADELRVIGRAGAGVDNIDLTAATRKGVLVMNTPGSNSTSAAEHAFALMLALARKIPFADATLREGQWNKKAFTGRELQDKIMGVIGLGKIGSILVERAKAFRMKVVAYDPFVSEKYADDRTVELLPLEEVLSRSDFISLHSPLNENTKGLIRAETLKLMKKGAFLINAARGGLVVEEDVAAALEEGHLGGAALDVFQNEPHITERLLKCKSAVFTPHIAGSTVEAQSQVGYDIAVQVMDFLRRGIILNAVNFPSLSGPETEHIQPYLSLGQKLGSFIGQISQIRLSEIGIRYYGDLTQVNYKPIGSYILESILKPMLSEQINEVNARSHAEERGISVVETVSSRQRSYSNLISIQLRSPETTEWVEGAILRKSDLRLVSIDGIPVETQLGRTILVIRNEDTPGVIGQVGTILGEAKINIASFVLGRDDGQPLAVGVVNTDDTIPSKVVQKIGSIPAVEDARVVRL